MKSRSPNLTIVLQRFDGAVDSLWKVISEPSFRGELGLEVWEIITILFGVVVAVIIVMFSFCLLLRKIKSERKKGALPLVNQIPHDSDEIKEISIDKVPANNHATHKGILCVLNDKFDDKDSEKGFSESKNGDDRSQSESFTYLDKDSITGLRPSLHNISAPTPLLGLSEFSHLGWGHWFTLRDLQIATNWFSEENIIGEGGYGIVYRGHLINGAPVAVKKLLNNLGQAEKEFTVEVEAIGQVRHKNLVRLLGYCIEGNHRLLVYEYVINGNLEQWLHRATHHRGCLSWEARVKILLGTAKALAYLHEAIEPKVVHRDIKSSNILIDDDFNAKISDFGLAKLLGAGKSHVTTRVMGTFGYVAPEYANSGLLNEKSDVYSFGVVLLEAITGRDPVDYGQPAPEVNLVNWLKMMVGSRRSEEVIDPNLEVRPSTSTLKRALLTALRCVDPDADKRPKMSQVILMLEAEEYPISREDRRRRRSQSGAAADAEPPRASYETDRSDTSGARSARMKVERRQRC